MGPPLFIGGSPGLTQSDSRRQMTGDHQMAALNDLSNATNCKRLISSEEAERMAQRKLIEHYGDTQCTAVSVVSHSTDYQDDTVSLSGLTVSWPESKGRRIVRYGATTLAEELQDDVDYWLGDE